MLKSTISKLTNVPSVLATAIIVLAVMAAVERNIGGIRRFVSA